MESAAEWVLSESSLPFWRVSIRSRSFPPRSCTGECQLAPTRCSAGRAYLHRSRSSFRASRCFWYWHSMRCAFTKLIFLTFRAAHCRRLPKKCPNDRPSVRRLGFRGHVANGQLAFGGACAARGTRRNLCRAKRRAEHRHRGDHSFGSSDELPRVLLHRNDLDQPARRGARRDRGEYYFGVDVCNCARKPGG